MDAFSRSGGEGRRPRRVKRLKRWVSVCKRIGKAVLDRNVAFKALNTNMTGTFVGMKH